MRVINLLPTYNEKENIGAMLEKLLLVEKKCKKHSFFHLVVDDYSPDGTAGIVKKYQKKHSNILLLAQKRVGLGKALINGYKYAIEKLKADVVITNDCDFSFDPAKIPLMLEKVTKGYDVVIGSRHVGKGTSEGWTALRRLNHYLANKFFAWHIAGIKQVYDHNGNFRAIRVKGVLDQISWNKISVKGFGFLMYMSYEISKHTKKIIEVPVVFKFRTIGESKVSFNKKYIKIYLRDVFEYIRICLLIRLEKIGLYQFYQN